MNPFKASFLAKTILVFILVYSNVGILNAQPQNYGSFQVDMQNGWQYDVPYTNGTFVTFRHYKNGKLNYNVRIKRKPVTCASKSEFNKAVRAIFQKQYDRADFVDKYKPNSEYSALGHKNCHMMTYISKKFDHRGFILSSYVNNKMYNIYIFDKVEKKKTLRKEVLDFIAGISLSEDPELIAAFEKTLENQKKELSEKTANEEKIVTNKTSSTKEKEKTSKLAEKKTTAQSKKKSVTLTKFDISNSSIPSSKPMPFLDIETLTKKEWDGAVSAAMEGMRLVYGHLSDAENEKFEKMWSPLRQTPFDEAVEYLNKFNPMLGEFLSYRASITQTCILMEEAFKNAGYAAEYDDQELSLGYLELAGKYQSLLVSRQKRLQQVTSQLVALGDPPNGAQLMAQQQRRYKKEKDYLKSLQNDHVPEGCWAGYRINFLGKEIASKIYKPAFVYVFKINRHGEDKLYGIRLQPNASTINNSTVNCESFKITHDNLQMLEGPVVQANLIDLDGRRTEELAIFLEKFEYPSLPQHEETSDANYANALNIANTGAIEAMRDKSIGGQIKVNNFISAVEDIQEMIACKSMVQHFYSTALKWSEEETWDDFYYSFDNSDLSNEILTSFSNAMARTTGNIQIAEKETTKNNVNNNEKKEDEEVTDHSGSDENWLHIIDDKNMEEREKIDMEAIEFHNNNIAIIKRNMERDRQDLDNEKDPIRRKDLQMRVLGAQANLQAESDRIATIKTGKIVHNRSAWDDYAKSNFIQKIAKDQRTMENISRGLRKAYETADKLPKEEARKVRRLINEKYDPGIVARMDEKAAQDIINQANAIGKKYFQGKIDEALADKQKADDEAAWAETCLETAQVVKTTADYSMMGLSLFGGKYINNVYQGITGYIEGGPKEAFLRVSGSYNTLTGIAVDGYRGFEAAVDKGGDVTDGLVGASWEAAKGFITEKALAFGLGKLSKSFNRPNGDVDVNVKSKVDVEINTKNNTGGTTARQPKIKEPDFNKPLTPKEIEVYRQQIADGRTRVNSYKKTYQKLETARKAGAPPAEIKKLLVELDNRSTKIHSSPQAKIIMKTMQKNPKNLDMIKRYSNSMDRVHKRVEKKFKAEMEKNNWDSEELVPIRNKPDPADLKKAREMKARGETVPPEALLGSKTVNMDYDAGRKPKLDADGQPIPPMKNGEPVPLDTWHNEAQATWEKVYFEETGQSPTHSWENITHGKVPDAYADSKVLERNGILQANKKWAGQTSDVTYFKAAHLENSPEFKKVEKYVEIARGTSKDCKTKMMPLLDQKKPKSGTKSSEAWQKHKKYWTDVNNVLDDMGSGKMDPMKADRSIRKITGGKSVLEVTKDMRDFMESLMILGKD